MSYLLDTAHLSLLPWYSPKAMPSLLLLLLYCSLSFSSEDIWYMSLEKDVLKCPLIFQEQLCKHAWEQLSHSTELYSSYAIFPICCSRACDRHSWKASKCHCMMLDKAEAEAEQGPFYFQVWHMINVAGLALPSSGSASMLELHHQSEQSSFAVTVMQILRQP